MLDQFTTVRVYRTDKEFVEEQFGGPTHTAFHKAIMAGCSHPEDAREYTTAMINGEDPMAGINEKQQMRTISGFRCGQCGRYVFPDPESK